MRVGIVELYCGSSGKQGFYNNQEIGIARALAKIGYECFIFYPQLNGKHIVEEKIDNNILIVNVPAKSIGVHSYYDWHVLQKYKIDVIQLDGDNQLFVPSISHFCDEKGIRIYNYLGTVKSDTDSKLKSKIMNLLFLRNLHVYKKHKCFVKTHALLNELNELGVSDVTVVPVGLDLAIVPEIVESQKQLREVLHLPAEKKILLFVGRMDSYKKPEEALKLLHQLPDDFSMVMIGTGSLDDEIEKQILSLKLDHRVRRIKKIPNSEIHKYYRSADYFLNFNDKEIFGMSILEAMYQDCSVIAVNAPGPKEIITNGEDGFIVSSTDEMKDLLLSGKRINKGSAHNSIINEFTWDKSVEKLDRWIKKDI